MCSAVWLLRRHLLARGFLQEVFIRLTEGVQQTFSDGLVPIVHFS